MPCVPSLASLDCAQQINESLVHSPCFKLSNTCTYASTVPNLCCIGATLACTLIPKPMIVLVASFEISWLGCLISCAYQTS